MTNPTQNRLLAALSPEDFELLRPTLTTVEMPVRKTLIAPDKPIPNVYFPEAGLSSDIALAKDDRPVECGLVGRDGLIGMPVVLGTDRSVHTSFMQVGGHGLRVASADLWSAMERSATLRRLLLNYAHMFMMFVAQSAACQARHTLDQRLARWLLLAHDRLPGDEVPLTHEYLSLMLGVRRAGVTEALIAAAEAGMVGTRRGVIVVRDRQGLEARSCSCYGIVEAERARVLGAARPDA